jgi:hypothetical protein
MLSPDTATCWSQFAYRTLSRIHRVGDQFEIDMRDVRQLPSKSIDGQFYLKIQSPRTVDWKVQGGRIQTLESPTASIQFFCIKPDAFVDTVLLSPDTSTMAEQPADL